MKSTPSYEQTLATLHDLVKNVLVRQTITPRASRNFDESNNTLDQQIPPKQIFEYNRRIMELTSKYKT